MYELTLKSRKQLERASLRAQAQKPRIEEVYFGAYKVWSTNPATPWKTYSTGIEPAPDGEGYTVCCSCPTQNYFCKHVAAVFPHYLMREKQEQGQVEAPATAQEPVAPLPLGCTTCGAVEANVFLTGGERLCWDCLKERAETEAMLEEVERMLAKDRQDIFG